MAEVKYVFHQKWLDPPKGVFHCSVLPSIILLGTKKIIPVGAGNFSFGNLFGRGFILNIITGGSFLPYASTISMAIHWCFL